MPMIPGQGGPPPELLAALLGAGGPPGPAGPPAMPGGQAPDDTGTMPQGAEGHLKQMLEHARAVLASQDVTEQERAAIEKATTLLQALLAGREKEHESLMGTTPQHRAMARSYG